VRKERKNKSKEGIRKGITSKRRLGRVEDKGEDKNNCCYVHCLIKDTCLGSERVIQNAS
jgi:hypothetical protein